VESLKDALAPPSSGPPALIDKNFLVKSWQQDQEDTEYDAADLPMQDSGDTSMDRTQKFEYTAREAVSILDERAITYKEDNDVEDEDDEDVHDGHSPADRLSRYGKLVVEAPAYQWLLASLKRECQLTRAEPDVMEDIKQEIIRYLPKSRKISRSRFAEAYRVTLQLNWDFPAFVLKQGYHGDLGKILETAVTLTGTNRDAQAQTCKEYLCQTWPHTGKHVMDLIKIVMCKSDEKHACK
jgi:hypothetical protein